MIVRTFVASPASRVCASLANDGAPRSVCPPANFVADSERIVLEPANVAGALVTKVSASPVGCSAATRIASRIAFAVAKRSSRFCDIDFVNTLATDALTSAFI